MGIPDRNLIALGLGLARAFPAAFFPQVPFPPGGGSGWNTSRKGRSARLNPTTATPVAKTLLVGEGVHVHEGQQKQLDRSGPAISSKAIAKQSTTKEPKSNGLVDQPKAKDDAAIPK